MLPANEGLPVQQATGRCEAACFADILSLRQQLLEAFLLAVHVKSFRIDAGRAEQPFHIGNRIQIIITIPGTQKC